MLVGAAQFLIMQVVVASAWSNPPYGWAANYISDLGNTACGPFVTPGRTVIVCSPRHVWMNASMVVIGVTSIIGMALLWHLWPKRSLATVGLVLWLVAGVGQIGVGLVPENRNLVLHAIAAQAIPLGSLSILLLSLAIRRSARALGLFGCAVGIIGLLGCVAFLIAQASDSDQVGLVERIAAYPTNLWAIVIGGMAMHSSFLHPKPHPTTPHPS